MPDYSGIEALFGGANLSNSSGADLINFQNTLASNDIWKQAAAPVLAAKFDTSMWTPNQSLAATAGQAFLGTLLKTLGQRDEGLQLEKVASILPAMQRDPASVMAPEGVDTAAFNALKMSQIKGQEASREKMFADLFSRNPATAISALPDVASKFGIDASPVDTTDANTPRMETDLPGLVSGRGSTSDKLKSYYQEFIAKGLPPTQAAVSARQQIEADIKANKQTFDEAKDARDKGQKLIDLAATARSGMSKAGVTGKFEGARELYDYLASSLGSADAERRRAGRQELGSIAPEIVNANKFAGALAVKEMETLLKAGPGVNQVPETNQFLVRKMEELGKLNLDYADFLDTYRELNGGTTVGAQQKWREYRSAFPLLKTVGDSVEINTDRPHWREFFSGKVAPTTTNVPRGLSRYTPAQIEYMKSKGIL